MEMTVAGLRRYPVKSMGGETLETVDVDLRGLVGDREFAVRDGAGKFASGKNTKRMARRDRIFEFAARTADAVAGSGSEVVVAHRGRQWRAGEPALDAHLTAALDAEVQVVAEAGGSHFDEGPVSLVGTATLEWCARELGVDADPRRLRVNIVVQTTEPFEEESWVGDVVVGGATLRPVGRLGRCRTIDAVQDGVQETTRWLKPLGERREAFLAIYCDVVSPGAVSVGDPVLPS